MVVTMWRIGISMKPNINPTSGNFGYISQIGVFPLTKYTMVVHSNGELRSTVRMITWGDTCATIETVGKAADYNDLNGCNIASEARTVNSLIDLLENFIRYLGRCDNCRCCSNRC